MYTQSSIDYKLQCSQMIKVLETFIDVAQVLKQNLWKIEKYKSAGQEFGNLQSASVISLKYELGHGTFVNDLRGPLSISKSLLTVASQGHGTCWGRMSTVCESVDLDPFLNQLGKCAYFPGPQKTSIHPSSYTTELHIPPWSHVPFANDIITDQRMSYRKSLSHSVT